MEGTLLELKPLAMLYLNNSFPVGAKPTKPSFISHALAEVIHYCFPVDAKPTKPSFISHATVPVGAKPTKPS